MVQRQDALRGALRCCVDSQYGKNIDWRSLPYTSHDVATIFRRYASQLQCALIL